MSTVEIDHDKLIRIEARQVDVLNTLMRIERSLEKISGDHEQRLRGIEMTAGTVTVSNACITGSRPIMLVEATPGGTQGFLSYSESAGSLTIKSSSSTDTSTVSWVQN